jgi:predicted transcriptional regulator
MGILKRIEQVRLLHQLIQTENTGTPLELSKRLHICRSTLYNIIDELKSYDAPIEYSRARKAFFYTHSFELNLRYSLEDNKGE